MRGALGATVDLVKAVRGTIAVRLGRVSRRGRVAAGGAVALFLVVPAVAWLLGQAEPSPYSGPEHRSATAPGSQWQQALNDVSSSTVMDGSEDVADEDAPGGRPGSGPGVAGANGGLPEDDDALLPAAGSPEPGRDSPGPSVEARAGNSDGTTSGGSSGSGRGEQDGGSHDGNGTGDSSDGPSSTTTTRPSSPTTAPGSGGDNGGSGDDDSGDGPGLVGGLLGGLVGGVTGLLSMG